MPRRWISRTRLLLLVSLAALAAAEAAKPYPTKPIRFVVPQPPGRGNVRESGAHVD